MYNKLLAMIIMYKHNVHILHWKTCGATFIQDHTYFGDLYGEMEGHIDIVAELGLQLGENPITLSQAINIIGADKSLDANNCYPGKNAFELIIGMYNDIIVEIDSIFANNNLSEGQKNDLSAIESWYSLKAKYLLPQRLVK